MDSVGLRCKGGQREQSPVSQVLGIGGSPRAKGNSDVLLDQIMEGVRGHGLHAETFHLRELGYLGCIGCEACRKDRICTGLENEMSLLYPKIIRARGLVLVSPTHNYNVTAWMKAFIDRLYCFYEFDEQRPRGWSSRLAGQGRRVALAAVCEQVDSADMGFTLEAMGRPLEALGYEITGQIPVFGIFDRGRVRRRRDIMEAAFKLGTQLARRLCES